MQLAYPNVNQLPWPQMEPLGQLAPYLNGLNVPDALESFNQLADSLLSGQQIDSNPPDERQYQFSPASSLYSPISVNSPSSTCSNFSSNSWCSSTDSKPSSHRSRLVERRSRRTRKTSNASAAERYRKRAKGLRSGLVEELALEEERNKKLRGDLMFKLSLYKEFVELLSSKLRLNDFELAQLGLKSLEKISSILAGENLDFCSKYERLFDIVNICSKDPAVKVSRQQQDDKRFEQEKSTLSSSQAGAKDGLEEFEEAAFCDLQSSKLIYDFYSDSFVDYQHSADL